VQKNLSVRKRRSDYRDVELERPLLEKLAASHSLKLKEGFRVEVLGVE